MEGAAGRSRGSVECCAQLPHPEAKQRSGLRQFRAAPRSHRLLLCAAMSRLAVPGDSPATVMLAASNSPSPQPTAGGAAATAAKRIMLPAEVRASRRDKHASARDCDSLYR